ncbi:Reverse transcriptase domain-containing protein [Aphis craccivora]|uniref:Reverse transcriptase domain-containing protein n=1 Tax=Aphis craccivora TaxID=307492 RepID=A0A6G0XQA0_APHCR|nr:Reverse transcriptase domain-containing protein [Aphis craccivora]
MRVSFRGHYVQEYSNQSFAKRKLRLQVWRADGRIIKQALMAKMTGKRPLGRPRTRWKDSVMKDLRVLQERAQLDVAYNREEWNKFVMAALDLNGPLSYNILS